MRAWGLSLVVGWAISGCAAPDQACDLMARASVQVEVVDGSGTTVDGAQVRFRVDGGGWQAAECMGAASDDLCDSWVAGWEEAGTFEIEASSADGVLTATEAVVVEEGECHVESESIALVLE